MKTILTVQHTEAEHHLSGHCGSRHEWTLTERGLETAFRIGVWLKEEIGGQSCRMYVSPQLRTRQTAEEINRSLDLTPVFRDELRECDAGEGCGMPMDWYRANKAPRVPDLIRTTNPFRPLKATANCGNGWNLSSGKSWKTGRRISLWFPTG